MSSTSNNEVDEATGAATPTTPSKMNGGDSSNPQEETGITMLDVLEQEQELEEEYAAVLGASDEKCCTYPLGPVKRQALYSCLTCRPDSKENLEKCAGICLACSFSCHENHELVELYTKRNFRCDCPTEKFTNRCALNPTLDKAQPLNKDNVYNQNFQGLYCICHRPYPDPERTVEELMLQCVICEDWLHVEHLGVKPTPVGLAKSANEMVCEDCMKRHEFLQDYVGFALKAVENSGDETQLNITSPGDTSICEDMVAAGGSRESKEADMVEVEGEGKHDGQVKKRKASEGDETGDPSHKVKRFDEAQETPTKATAVASSNDCRRPQAATSNYDKGAAFWANDWRSLLCRCAACLSMYANEKVEFLLDDEDSAKSYEERGMASTESIYEQGIRALSSMNRVQQIDAITEYNHMKDRLKEFLQTFAATKRIVTKEDINHFFAEMRDQKNSNLGQPYFCR